MSLSKIFVNNQDTGFEGIPLQGIGSSTTRPMSQRAVTQRTSFVITQQMQEDITYLADKTDDYFYNPTLNHPTGPHTNWKYFTLLVKPGQEITVHTKSGQSAPGIQIRNENFQTIYVSEDYGSEVPTEKTLSVIVPPEGFTLISNLGNVDDISIFKITLNSEFGSAVNASSVFLLINQNIYQK